MNCDVIYKVYGQMTQMTRMLKILQLDQKDGGNPIFASSISEFFVCDLSVMTLNNFVINLHQPR